MIGFGHIMEGTPTAANPSGAPVAFGDYVEAAKQYIPTGPTLFLIMGGLLVLWLVARKS